jgi:hypothetical protein
LNKTVFIICWCFLNTLGVISQNDIGSILKLDFNSEATNDILKSTNGKLHGATLVPDRFGNENSAVYLQGAFGSYINLGNTNVLKPSCGSISLWVNISHAMLHGKGVESNPILFTRSQNTEDYNEAYYIGYDYPTNSFNINTTISKEHQVTMYSISNIKLRSWYHLVITYDNDYLKLYINGRLANSLPKNFRTVFLDNDSVFIGSRRSNKNNRFFNGNVDDIEFFNKVLTNAEVKDLYNSPDPNKDRRITRIVLYVTSILFLLALIVIYIKMRIKRLMEKEKEKNQLINHALEQEIKMLKAQMDPHFMFNSLNTILQFIIIKENVKAELYLTKFSKLIRKLLETNIQNSISLTDELSIINKYLEIESLRFDTKLEANIEIGDRVNIEEIHVPQMLIQPFIENAIWHGLILKEGEKKLIIRFEKLNDKTLLCIIDDNGVGRKQTVKTNIVEKGKPLAINFVKQRLELMSKIYNCSYSVEVIDKVDEQSRGIGTCVELKMPIID